MHVNVTKELYRTYKRQLDVLNDAILRRCVSHMRVHNVDEKKRSPLASSLKWRRAVLSADTGLLVKVISLAESGENL